MKIVITGITGFVGTYLSEYLSSRNHQIIGLTRANGPNNDQIKQSQFSKLLTYDELEQLNNLGPEVFIHLAGKAHDTKNNADSSEYDQINVGLTQKVYQSFLQSGAKKFIFMSSVKAVADSVEGYLDENSVPNPATDYGRSKLKAEQYIIENMIAGKKYYILRPCMIHGPGNQGNLNLLFQFVNKGIPYPLGAYDNRRSFLSIENLAFILDKICNSDLDSDTFHLSDDRPISSVALIKLMGSTLHRKVRIWNIPPPLITFIARLGDYVPIPINSNRLQKLTENYLVSNRKIKKSLNIELPVGSVEGMKRTFASFKS